jgi:hypothetical protein
MGMVICLQIPRNILNGWKNYFSQLLSARRVSGVRQIEIHTAEPLVSEPSSSETEITTEKMQRYKSSRSDQFPSELIQTGREILRSQIINSQFCLNNGDLPE